MILTYIETDAVSKACPREYFKLMLELKKCGLDFSLFSTYIHTGMKPQEITDFHVLEELYQKILRKFKKKTGYSIQLSAETMRPWKATYNSRNTRFTDVEGKEISMAMVSKPIWTIELKLAPSLKKLNPKIIHAKEL